MDSLLGSLLKNWFTPSQPAQGVLGDAMSGYNLTPPSYPSSLPDVSQPLPTAPTTVPITPTDGSDSLRANLDYGNLDASNNTQQGGVMSTDTNTPSYFQPMNNNPFQPMSNSQGGYNLNSPDITSPVPNTQPEAKKPQGLLSDALDKIGVGNALDKLDPSTVYGLLGAAAGMLGTEGGNSDKIGAGLKGFLAGKETYIANEIKKQEADAKQKQLEAEAAKNTSEASKNNATVEADKAAGATIEAKKTDIDNQLKNEQTSTTPDPAKIASLQAQSNLLSTIPRTAAGAQELTKAGVSLQIEKSKEANLKAIAQGHDTTSTTNTNTRVNAEQGKPIVTNQTIQLPSGTWAPVTKRFIPNTGVTTILASRDLTEEESGIKGGVKTGEAFNPPTGSVTVTEPQPTVNGVSQTGDSAAVNEGRNKGTSIISYKKDADKMIKVVDKNPNMKLGEAGQLAANYGNFTSKWSRLLGTDIPPDILSGTFLDRIGATADERALQSTAMDLLSRKVLELSGKATNPNDFRNQLTRYGLLTSNPQDFVKVLKNGIEDDINGFDAVYKFNPSWNKDPSIKSIHDELNPKKTLSLEEARKIIGK